MSIREILLLGNPTLRKKCKSVNKISSNDTHAIIADLADTLEDFRKHHGFGRGIAAPQIGVTQQIIYIDSDYRGALINPRIIRHSRESIRVWDDCFSFPDIVVQISRKKTVVVQFMDEQGVKQQLKAQDLMAELLQHEIDHLNGILAIDRAVNLQHIIMRSEYEKHNKHPLMKL